MTPPKTRPDFGEFHAPEPESKPQLSREDFAGLEPREAVNKMLDFMLQHQDLGEKTVRQKRTVLKRMLKDFQQKGLDMSTVAGNDAQTYRAFLLNLVRQEVISHNYASHVVVQWNAAMRAVFGETSRPGEGLIMRGFKQTPRKVDHLNEADFVAIVAAAQHKDFQSQHYRLMFHAYMELAWCAGARIGSLNNPKLRVCDVYWDKHMVHLRHMKNVDQHEVVLTDRALAALRQWVDFLSQTKAWIGRETPLFAGPNGKLASSQWYNRTMKQVAAIAGIRKQISSHVIRKSAGTIMARENPKLAQEQLGVTEKIFNRHYNQPLLEDRIARRDILPGAESSPSGRIGDAYMRFQRGQITKNELDIVVAQARVQAVEPQEPTQDVSYV